MSVLTDIKVPDVHTKRRYIYETLRRQILAAEIAPGTKFPPASVLCQQFAVSYMTMHAALNDLVRDGCLIRHRGKGTFVADASARKKRPMTTDLVVVLPVQEDIINSSQSSEVFQFLHGCTAGASAAQARLGMMSIPSRPGEDEVRVALEQILAHDGAIFIGDQYDGLMTELGRRHFPVAAYGVGDVTKVAARVEYDRADAVRQGMRHLIEHGYHRIGLLGALAGPGSKYNLFRELLAEHGLALDAAWVQQCSSIHDAFQDAHALLSRQPRPQAVFVDNHRKALALIQVAQLQGLAIPRDLAVMGYGADTASQSSPHSLSLVALPYADFGRQCAQMLDHIIRGQTQPPACRIVQANLVIRQSCGCDSPAMDTRDAMPEF
ncbi:MAG: substrate-binding domain-containing protein [Phycisphaeraceae bacterium]|nr:substrate-binding domain-containing protein [Phycisphaeraceae bacterium]